MAEYQSLGMVSMEFKDWSIFFDIKKYGEMGERVCCGKKNQGKEGKKEREKD